MFQLGKIFPDMSKKIVSVEMKKKTSERQVLRENWNETRFRHCVTIALIQL